MYQCKHFKIHELVPKYIFDKYGKKGWRIFDEKLLITIDTIKEVFPEGAAYINNYYWYLSREWSGLRTPDSPYYSVMSMHSYAKAVDILFTDYHAEEVRKHIILHPEVFPHIKGMELGVSWLHVDTRSSDKLITFSK